MKNIYKLFLVFFAFLFLPLVLHSQVTQEWINFYYNSTRNAQGQYITQDSSGNIIVAGSGGGQNFAVIKYDNAGTQKWVKMIETDPLYSSPDCLIADKYGDIYFAFTSWSLDFVFIKISKDGAILWQRTYSSTSSGGRQITGIVLTSSGYPIFCGMLPFAGTKEDYFMIKYTPSGDTLWTARYNSLNNNSDYAYSLALGKDGSLLITGYRKNNSPWLSPGFLSVKYDSNGVFKWARTYGDSNSASYLYDGAFDDYGNAYVLGYLNTHDYCTIKYNAVGDFIWSKIFSNLYSSAPKSIRIDKLNNVIVTGIDYAENQRFISTVKYDSSGNQLWVNYLLQISPNNTILNNRNCIILDNANNIYLTGFYYITISGSEMGTFTAKVSSNGTSQWFKTFYGNMHNEYGGKGIVLDKNMNVYTVGTTQDSINGFGFVTIKYSQPTAITQISADIPNNFKLFQNYPNPFNSTTVISYQLSVAGRVSLKVFDILGKEIKTLVNEKKEPGTYETSFNGQGLASGIYIYELKVINQDGRSLNYREVRRMVLLK